MVLHYGNDLSVDGTGYNFSKIEVREANFDATLCPPWALPADRVGPGGLLPYPPSPLSLPSQVQQPVTTPTAHLSSIRSMLRAPSFHDGFSLGFCHVARCSLDLSWCSSDVSAWGCRALIC